THEDAALLRRVDPRDDALHAELPQQERAEDRCREVADRVERGDEALQAKRLQRTPVRRVRLDRLRDLGADRFDPCERTVDRKDRVPKPGQRAGDRRAETAKPYDRVTPPLDHGATRSTGRNGRGRNRLHPRPARRTPRSGPDHLRLPRPGPLHQRCEHLRIPDRQVRENHAVHLHARLLQPVHEPRVVHAVLPSRGVDPRDPELPELTLPLLAVTVRVLPAPLDRILRDPPQLRTGAPVPPRRLQVLLLLPMPSDGVRHTSHSSPPQLPPDPLLVRAGHHPRLTQPPLALRRLLRQDVALVRLVTTDPARTRQPEPLRHA